MTDTSESYPEGLGQAAHIAHDMRMGRFPKRSSITEFLAERAERQHQVEPSLSMLGLIQERDALLARMVELEAERYAVRKAMTEAAIWHEAQAKALSKQPPSGDRGWRRSEHQEQAVLLRAYLDGYRPQDWPKE